jgi:hypothetical protein
MTLPLDVARRAADWEAKHDVRLLSKKDSLPMRFVRMFLWSFDSFWTTYRLPFCKPVIAYPPRVVDPTIWEKILLHELVHVEQFRPWYGPLKMALLAAIFPLPILFSGRWHIERDAYLQDIRIGRLTTDEAVDSLWYGYMWPWPRPWMRRWFQDRLEKVG